MRTKLAVFVGLLGCGLSVGVQPALAGPTPVLDAHVSTGLDPDTTVIGRVLGGGMLVFDNTRIAIDAHISFSGFLRINDSKGISARSFSPLNLGARYAFRNARFHGPYVALGAGFGFFGGAPKERKVSGDEEVCATAMTEVAGQCTFDITQNINARLGFGWGFPSGKRTTVGVRVDLAYWAFNVANGEDQQAGAPVARLIPRPQDTFALMIGLEFMRWR